MLTCGEKAGGGLYGYDAPEAAAKWISRGGVPSETLANGDTPATPLGVTLTTCT